MFSVIRNIHKENAYVCLQNVDSTSQQSHSHYSVCSQLLVFSLQLSMRDEDKSLLHFAAAKGRVGIVRVLLEHNADMTATTVRH